MNSSRTSGTSFKDKLKRPLALVPHLKKLIETSTVGQEESPNHPRKDAIVKFIPLYNDAVIDGEYAKTETLIGVDRDGNLFYDIFLNEKRNRQAEKLSSTPNGLFIKVSQMLSGVKGFDGTEYRQTDSTAPKSAFDPVKNVITLFF